MTPASWDDMTPQALFDLLTKEGRSYGELAKMYGVTRNTVSGQVYRWRQANAFPEELPSMSKAPKAKPEQKVLKGPPVRKTKAKTNVNLPKPVENFVVPKRETPITKPTNDPVSILDLEHDMCAVVVQEKPVLYCGCRPLKNHKFRMCAYHASTMVDPPATRRKARGVAKPVYRG